VVKSLTTLADLRPLPPKERELYDNARHLLVSEVSAASGLPEGSAEDAVDLAMFPPGKERVKPTLAMAMGGEEGDELGLDEGLEATGLEEAALEEERQRRRRPRARRAKRSRRTQASRSKKPAAANGGEKPPRRKEPKPKADKPAKPDRRQAKRKPKPKAEKRRRRPRRPSPKPSRGQGRRQGQTQEEVGGSGRRSEAPTDAAMDTFRRRRRCVIRLVTLDPIERETLDKLTRIVYQAYGLGCEYAGDVPIPKEAAKGEALDAVELIAKAQGVKSFADDKIVYITAGRSPRASSRAQGADRGLRAVPGERAGRHHARLPTGEALLKRLANWWCRRRAPGSCPTASNPRCSCTRPGPFLRDRRADPLPRLPREERAKIRLPRRSGRARRKWVDSRRSTVDSGLRKGDLLGRAPRRLSAPAPTLPTRRARPGAPPSCAAPADGRRRSAAACCGWRRRSSSRAALLAIVSTCARPRPCPPRADYRPPPEDRSEARDGDAVLLDPHRAERAACSSRACPCSTARHPVREDLRGTPGLRALLPDLPPPDHSRAPSRR
jgi:hypothetical protein